MIQMTLYIKETGEKKELYMKNWENTQWSCDFFNDIETDVRDGSDVTAEKYAEIVSFWEDEVNAHNKGLETEMFGEYNGVEIGFFYD